MFCRIQRAPFTLHRKPNKSYLFCGNQSGFLRSCYVCKVSLNSLTTYHNPAYHTLHLQKFSSNTCLLWPLFSYLLTFLESHILFYFFFLNNLSTFPHSKIIYFVPGGTSFTFWSSCSSCFPPTHRKSRQELTFLLTSCQTWLRFLNNEIIALWGFFFFFSQPLLKLNMDQVTKIQTLGVRCIQWPENT